MTALLFFFFIINRCRVKCQPSFEWQEMTVESVGANKYSLLEAPMIGFFFFFLSASRKRIL